ncbi:MAG TPA: response regulator transcription factor [Polyangia bacterium]|nr:response regulator transcription factor [Polyangia bacterium]
MSEAGTPRLVVIVEDDGAIAEGLALNLKLQGYRTEIVGDAETAVDVIASSRPALVLLDISLPKRSGLWVLETLRGQGDSVPVIVLSARQDEFDKVAALRLGADDYVTKPFALAELLARVAAVLRRAPPDRAPTGAPAAPPSSFRFGDVVVDLAARTVTRAGKGVKLTHLEFELLAFFCCNDDRVFSREELLREVWGLRQATPARTVDNFVAQLRAKLEADPDSPVYLLTVRGSGYRFARGAR